MGGIGGALGVVQLLTCIVAFDVGCRKKWKLAISSPRILTLGTDGGNKHIYLEKAFCCLLISNIQSFLLVPPCKCCINYYRKISLLLSSSILSVTYFNLCNKYYI